MLNLRVLGVWLPDNFLMDAFFANICRCVFLSARVDFLTRAYSRLRLDFNVYIPL